MRSTKYLAYIFIEWKIIFFIRVPVIQSASKDPTARSAQCHKVDFRKKVSLKVEFLQRWGLWRHKTIRIFFHPNPQIAISAQNTCIEGEQFQWSAKAGFGL